MSGPQTWQLPSIQLPEGEHRPLWARDGRLTTEPVDGAEPLPGTFALPGLVDAHRHLFLRPEYERGDMAFALETWARARDTGALLLRDLGAPASLTLDLPADPLMPRLQVAGRWLARAGLFFPAWHEPVEPDGLVEAALAEVRRGATWVKVVTDFRGRVAYDGAALGPLVDAVHAAGARVAAHSQTSNVGAVIDAGADSIEHGDAIDEPVLRTMATRGVAWTTTLSVAESLIIDSSAERQAYLRESVEHIGAMLPLAARLGVTIMGGTDGRGTIADEVAAMVRHGLEPVQALRAVTTDARAFLREPGLDDGAPADVVTYDADPRNDPEVLARPAAILLGGVRVK